MAFAPFTAGALADRADVLPRPLAHSDPAVAARVFTAIQGVAKLNVGAIERAVVG